MPNNMKNSTKVAGILGLVSGLSSLLCLLGNGLTMLYTKECIKEQVDEKVEEKTRTIGNELIRSMTESCDEQLEQLEES